MKKIVLGAAVALLAAQPAAFAQVSAGLTQADLEAAYHAARFTKYERGFSACDAFGWGKESKTWVIDAGDINGDGRNDLWVSEEAEFCYGYGNIHTSLVISETKGGYRLVLTAQGEGAVQTTKTNGWPDIIVGTPGMPNKPLFKYAGEKYQKAK